MVTVTAKSLETIKYLGKASDVTLEDIPDEFLKDSEVHVLIAFQRMK